VSDRHAGDFARGKTIHRARLSVKRRRTPAAPGDHDPPPGGADRRCRRRVRAGYDETSAWDSRRAIYACTLRFPDGEHQCIRNPVLVPVCASAWTLHQVVRWVRGRSPCWKRSKLKVR
jgi:hypothetical protein